MAAEAALQRAFGLTVRAEPPLRALAPAAGPAEDPPPDAGACPPLGAASGPPLDAEERPPLELSLAGGEEIRRGWPAGEATCVEMVRAQDGRIGLRIEAHPEAGYRFEVGAFGSYRLSADASRALCAPVEVEPWRRERFLVARVLPLAALVRGHEVLHAGAVAMDGQAVALLGPSRAGKTSLALHLTLRGAALLTDDLLAVAPAGEGVLAHPGSRLVGVRHSELELLGQARRERLGEFVDRGDKAYAHVGGAAAEAAPLRLVYLLARRAQARRPTFEPLDPPDPRQLLGATFFPRAELTRARLVRQLEICARVARSAAVFRAVIPSGMTAAQAGAEIERHARARLAGARAA